MPILCYSGEGETMEGERQKQVQKEIGALVAGLALLEEDMRGLKDALADVLTNVPPIDEEPKVEIKDEKVLVPLAKAIRGTRNTCTDIRYQIAEIKKRLEV